MTVSLLRFLEFNSFFAGLFDLDLAKPHFSLLPLRKKVGTVTVYLLSNFLLLASRPMRQTASDTPPYSILGACVNPLISEI